ncbi:hypothetical protein EDB83DRAFT_2519849 [Lactarius deliciosus]|nr:hypothetical protein EDB83DRAFT_2519849 [Lactarius deliciosus]
MSYLSSQSRKLFVRKKAHITLDPMLDYFDPLTRAFGSISALTYLSSQSRKSFVRKEAHIVLDAMLNCFDLFTTSRGLLAARCKTSNYLLWKEHFLYICPPTIMPDEKGSNTPLMAFISPRFFVRKKVHIALDATLICFNLFTRAFLQDFRHLLMHSRLTISQPGSNFLPFIPVAQVLPQRPFPHDVDRLPQCLFKPFSMFRVSECRRQLQQWVESSHRVIALDAMLDCFDLLTRDFGSMLQDFPTFALAQVLCQKESSHRLGRHARLLRSDQQAFSSMLQDFRHLLVRARLAIFQSDSLPFYLSSQLATLNLRLFPLSPVITKVYLYSNPNVALPWGYIYYATHAQRYHFILDESNIVHAFEHVAWEDDHNTAYDPADPTQLLCRQPYHIDRRGERNVPTKFLKAAYWKDDSHDIGYVARDRKQEYPVEFNFDRVCWCELKWDHREDKYEVIKPTSDAFNCNILASEAATREQWGPIDGQPEEETHDRSPTPKTPAPSPSLKSNPEEIHILGDEELREEEHLQSLAEHIPILTDIPRMATITEAETQARTAFLGGINPDTGHRHTDPHDGGDGGDGGNGGGGHGGDPAAGPPPGVIGPGPTERAEKFFGREPTPFTGDRTKAAEFFTQWELFVNLNDENLIMRTPYRKAMLFLTYIQGPLVNEWILSTANWLKQEKRTIGPNDPWLWQAVEVGFKRQFTDTLEEEKARQELRARVKMEKGDIDSYIAKFERLVRQSNYRLSDPLVLDYFTTGLPVDLYCNAYQFHSPNTYAQWKTATIEQQKRWIHMNARMRKPPQTQGQGRPQRDNRGNPPMRPWQPPQRQQGWQQYRNHPDAMDTTPGRVRARLANAEEVLKNEYQQRSQNRGPRGRGIIDARDVTCYTCHQKGHFSRNCPTWQRQGPQVRGAYIEEVQSIREELLIDFEEGSERAARASTSATPQERANEWLDRVAGLDEEAKGLVMKELWGKKDFQDA